MIEVKLMKKTTIRDLPFASDGDRARFWMTFHQSLQDKVSAYLEELDLKYGKNVYSRAGQVRAEVQSTGQADQSCMTISQYLIWSLNPEDDLAAWFANNIGDAAPTTKSVSVVDAIAALIPALNQSAKCPAHPDLADARCIYYKQLSELIIHLNDRCGWTREDVADWLDTLDLDLRFPLPEEVPHAAHS